MVNEDGAVTSYTYDAKGRCIEIKDAYDHSRLLEYDPMDRITADTDENGVRRTYEYDEKGNLIKYTDGLGNSETYTYDKNNNMVSLTNRNGNTYTYKYDALNRPVSETDPKGNTKSFGYDKNSKITSVTDRNGNTTKYTLDGNGNIVTVTDAAGTESHYEYDSMNRLIKIFMHRVDTVHKVDEWQDTLYTYDYRGLVKTEVNAKGDGKVFVYDENGNLISKTDEDGYVTEYGYSPVNLVNAVNYNDAKNAAYLYNGTGELIEMEDWNGKTSFSRDLLNRITKVTDHNGRETAYGWDNVGNKTVQGYPDGTQADYYYDAENQIVEVVDPDEGITKYEYDPNGNKTFKEYPNYETAYYFYDVCDQIIEMDEYNLNGKKFFKTTYSWDAEGNMFTEMQYNHGQSGTSGKGNSGNNGNGNGNNKKNSTDTTALSSILEGYSVEIPTTALPQIQLPSMEDLLTNSQNVSLPESMAAIEELQNGIVTEESTESTDPTPDAPEAEAPTISAGTEESSSTETDTDNSNNGTSKNPEGFEWGNGNGEVPPGQNVDENGNITNNGGNTPPGLNRRNKEKPDKDDNPNKPEKPDNPGSEDKSDSSANKAQQGTHIYTYDNLNRMSTSDIAKTKTTYTYDTLGNLVYEKIKNKSVDYQYNELNQLVKRTDSQNQTYTYQYDKRGNRIAEIGKKESRAFTYDETNHLVEGTNWKGDKSAYTYNALFVRINNTQTSHSGSVYSRDYVIDYTSLERDDLMIYAEGDGQLDYVQREVYAGSERIEQFTDRSNGGYERTLYVHEDVQGNTRYYTKTNGNSFAELTYDAWGMPVSPNKLLNNDHGNYVYATYTGHIFDTTLDIYFAEARFYDAQTRTWLAMDPIKDGDNWYQYVYSNPIIYFDPNGLWVVGLGLDLNGVLGAARAATGRQALLDGHGNYGIMNYVSFGGGIPSFSTGVSVTVSYSSTDNIYNLGGLSAGVGGAFNATIGGIPLSVGVDVSFGNANGELVTQYTFILGLELDIPIDLHGFDVYATIEKAGEIPPEIKAKLKQAKGFVMELVEKAQGNLLNYFHLFSGC